jgi:hypothetical protein
MGDILTFSAKDRSPGRATPAKLEGASPRALGQILLFTGVRYQHDDAPPAPRRNDSRPDPTSMGGGGRRRKRG